MTDLARDRELHARAAKARRRRARQFAGMLLLIGIVSGLVMYVGINLLALAVAP